MSVPSGDLREPLSVRYSKENFPNILKLADNLKRIGEQYNATAGQVALAWLLAQGDDIIPIPGTKKIKVSDSITAYILGHSSMHPHSILRRTSLL
jgi:aryl-alcohol dehydrogenase-like predicted oxidoreductase